MILTKHLKELGITKELIEEAVGRFGVDGAAMGLAAMINFRSDRKFIEDFIKEAFPGADQKTMDAVFFWIKKEDDMTYYKQCLIKKNNMIVTSWIPEKFAKLNKVLKMKVEGEWVEGWTVKKVYDLRIEEKEVIRNRDAHLHQREVSDI